MTDRPGTVIKVIEVVGSSPRPFGDGVRNAVLVASQSLRDIEGVDVVSSGERTLYKVHRKIAFVVEGSEASTLGDEVPLTMTPGSDL